MKYTFSSIAIAAMIVAPDAIAQATNSDDISVSLSVDIARVFEVGFDGDVSLTNQEAISDYDGPNVVFTQDYYTGFTTGCIHVSGADTMNVTVTGANTVGGVVGPMLKHNDGVNDYYLYYQPALAVGPVGTDFSSMLAKHRGSQVNDGVSNIYGNFDGSNHVNGHTAEVQGFEFSIGGPSESGCPSGNNAAFGVMVGIDGGGHEADEANSIFGDVNRFRSASGLADGTYAFNDTVTVEITPAL